MLIDRSGRIWGMRPDGVMISEAIALREAGVSPVSIAGEQLAAGSFAKLVDGVAVIPVYGPLMRSMSMWFWSYEEVARDLAIAQTDARVRAIVLDIDSPGGLVAGCGDLAQAIQSSGPKPVRAFVGGLAASAAYWLASGASEIVVGSGATIGSIGAVIEYVDIQPMFAKMGARLIRVVSDDSPNKRLDPESPEGRAEMQDLVNAACAEFVAGVAAGRGIGTETVLSDFGQGLVFEGNEAIRRGMADRRGTLMELVAELADRDVDSNADAAPAAEESPMDWASLTSAALREHRPDLAAEIENAAAATADKRVTDAVAAERSRMLAIDEIAASAPAALVAAAKKDGRSAADLAFEVMKANAGAGKKHLDTLATEDVDVPTAEATSKTIGGTPQEQAEAKWQKDAKLRAEFGGNKDAFLAFAKAEAAGLARVLTRN